MSSKPPTHLVTLTQTTASRATVIRLNRTSEWKNVLRAFAVYIDGVKVGKIRNGKTLSFLVDPGEHRLMVKIDWCVSNTLVINLPDGVTADFTCGSGFAASRPGAAAFSGVHGAYVALWATGV